MARLLNGAAPRAQLRRLTFHEFMLHEVHGRLFRYQHIPDPLAAVADRLMRDMRVLCLDEFFVTDVADATILARLFGYLWDRGLVLVATSNRRAAAAARATGRGLRSSRWDVGGGRTPSVARVLGRGRGRMPLVASRAGTARRARRPELLRKSL